MYIRLCPSPHVVFSKGLPVLSGGDCLREQEEGMGGLIPSETLRTEDNGPVDPKGSPLKEQVSENLHGRESGVKVVFLNMWNLWNILLHWLFLSFDQVAAETEDMGQAESPCDGK